MRPVGVLYAALAVAFLIPVAGLTEVAAFGRHRSAEAADAALVLGAAVFGDSPSPVFQERIRHAVTMYQAGQVRVLVMTGGLAPGDRLSEGEAAAEWARKQGVPDSAMLIEKQSRTTRENITNSIPLLREGNLHRILIVSDPLHMRRSMAIARSLGLDAHPSPTPTTRYTGWASWAGFLLSETYHLNRCRILQAC